MKKNEFIEVVEKLGYTAELVSTYKGSGVMFYREGDTVRPTVYDDGIERFQDREEVAEWLDSLAIPNFNENMFTRNAFEKNAFLCIGKKTSGDVLKRDYLDLELQIRMKIDGIEGGTTRILNSHLPMLGLNADEAFNIAIRNSENSYRIGQLFDDKMFVATNDMRQFGASILAFPDKLKNFLNEQGYDWCWILPSSIHEIILVTEGERSQLDAMIADVNASQVAEYEQLSDHAYLFDGTITY